MIRFFACLWLLLFHHAAGAQVAIDQGEDMNILYAGIDNPLTIAAEHIPADKLIVTTDNGSIRGDSGHYSIVPYHPNERTVVTVSVYKQNKIVELGRTYFKVKCITSIGVALCGKSGGAISLGAVQHTIAPIGYLENFEIDAHIPIISFTVLVNRDGVLIFSKTIRNARGARLNEDAETKKMISNLRIGDELKLTNLSYNGMSEGCNGSLRPLEFVIAK